MAIYVFYLEVVSVDELFPRWVYRLMFAIRGTRVSVKIPEVVREGRGWITDAGGASGASENCT